MKPAIIAIGYNRPHSLKRLLTSLNNAYYDYDNIKLIISIDHSKHENDEKNAATISLARSFEWQHGEKEVIYREKNMGLRPHVLACGNLTEKYGSIIMLEDDIYASPMFYKYACAALDFCQDKDYVAGISLYNHKLNFQTGDLFYPIEDGYDNWYLKFPQSWGQAWTRDQWQGFKRWYDQNSGLLLQDDNMPATVLSWPESSWMKYFARYMLLTNKFFFYPKCSFTTNSCDAGTNSVGNYNDISYQVPFFCSFARSFYFSDICQSGSVYDQFFENVNLYKTLGIAHDKLTVDLFGHKPVPNSGFLLSLKHLDFKIIKSYACSQRPLDMNIINDISGQNFYLYDLSEKAGNKFKTSPKLPLSYNYKALDRRSQLLIALTFLKNCFSSVKRRIIK